ncbi:hypothetical protein [Nesterenkonia natronophila]|uniref:DUF4232 domain-containing protein n=1 Tax=Nesterenkonia natronophila TaxID=2174932 RepID=A0A3A4G327_9MICC|nr:hypothetical protein [Nesterenkonia natronophila]RJN32629.1 hypothetical protein D3250_02000 [Nesterenkonia natronophila]
MTKRRRPSPAVYRRRRLAAALLAVFLLALGVWGARVAYDALTDEGDQTGATALDDAEEQNDYLPASPEPTEEEDAASEQDEQDEEDDAAEEAVEEGHCAPDDIDVRASTSHEVYDASTAPLLIMEIEHIGSEECTLDVGTAEQEYRVSTGGREIFTTAQCDLEGEPLEMDLEPGQTERANMLWPRSDSSVDCSEPADLATADYELTVAVSGITSAPHTFEMTGRAE